MSTNGTNYSEKYSTSISGNAADANQNSTSGNNLSKDEVGWYFVEQYYTTLSKSPDKLHLFYSKKSQFVYGLEAEVTSIAVGRQDILEQIQKLDFQDCKVRISNVDSQASLDNIVIQVIGETSNKSEEPKKFVQTFVLAQQPSGYFVLNDILRFIKEEDVDAADATTIGVESEAVAPAATKPELAAKAEAAAPAAVSSQAAEAKPEELAAVQEVAPAAAIPAAVESAPVGAKAAEASAPVAAVVAPVADVKKTAEEASEAEKKTEAPKESAAAAAPAAAPAAVKAEKPKEPAKPMTWASRAAAAAGSARPPVALPKPAAAAAGASKPAGPAPAAAAPAPAAAAKVAVEGEAAAAPAAPAGAKESGNEWQTAGSDSKRQNRPQSISASAHDKDNRLGYVKNVTDKVEDAALRQHLEKFGQLLYFEISRPKNCAFIEYASSSAQLSAVSANPHTVNGESILVEARHPKASAYGGVNYRNNRGGASGRGRGGFEGRSSSQGGGRGGFTGQNRGRGGPSAARGRGASQAAA